MPVRRLKVLLVEDNDFTRSTVAAALRAEECVIVAAASTAKEAVAAVEDHDIDCAVIDLHLGPGPTGIDVAYALRQHDPDVGIVLLTAYADSRLLSGGNRPLPPDSVYAVKNDIRSTAQLREKIDIAMGDISRPAGQSLIGYVPLTDGQMEMLRMVADGLTNTEIAKRRTITERAVETGLARIMRKLEIEPKAGENPRVLLVQTYHQLIGGTSSR